MVCNLETFLEFGGFYFQIVTGSDCRSGLREGKIEGSEDGSTECRVQSPECARRGIDETRSARGAGFFGNL
jgi:hypothetical protein